MICLASTYPARPARRFRMGVPTRKNKERIAKIHLKVIARDAFRAGETQPRAPTATKYQRRLLSRNFYKNFT